MKPLIYSDFKEELEKIEFTNHKVTITDESLKIVTMINWGDVLDLIIALLLSSSFLVSTSLLIPSLLCFVLFWHRLYVNFRGIGIVQINFRTTTIVINNRIFLINIFRRIFGIPSKSQFNAVEEISFQESSLMDRLGYLQLTKKYLVLLETTKDAPLAITQFKNEENAKAMVAFLKKIFVAMKKL